MSDTIAADRIELVPVRVEHAAEMAVVLADPALYAFIGGVPPSEAALRTQYQAWLAGSPDPAVTWCNWVIQCRGSGRLAGTVQATITRTGGRAVAEIAWVVGTPWQGKGLAREAAQALVGWLRRQPVDAIVAHIHPDHLASAAVAAAAGLAPTGRYQDGERQWELPGELPGELPARP